MTTELLELVVNLFSENKALFLVNVFLEVIIPPLEIYLFTDISRTLLDDLRTNSILKCKNRKYIGYLFLLQILNFYNRESFNRLNNPIRLSIRNAIKDGRQDDHKLLLIFMPLAIHNFRFAEREGMLDEI